jgi:hypothetical protein
VSLPPGKARLRRRFAGAQSAFDSFAEGETSRSDPHETKRREMAALLLVLLLILILGAAGFALKVLWIFALILLVLWLVGFLVRGAEGARWYRW